MSAGNKRIVLICVSNDANAAPDAPHKGIIIAFSNTFVIAAPIYKYLR